MVEQHETDHIHLLFNNAGLSGGGSLFTDSRESWDRCFAVCWGGVYYGTRAFLPLLVAADEGHIINTSSVNGFWASMGPERPHTAYSAAKFAVKGFTEALITDLRVNAPHVKCSVVMPGHIGTSIVQNSVRHGVGDELDPEMQQLIEAVNTMFRDNAPMSAGAAATVILQGVRDERWRILVGDDAVALDKAVRAAPEDAYEGMLLGSLNDAIEGIEVDPRHLTVRPELGRRARLRSDTNETRAQTSRSRCRLRATRPFRARFRSSPDLFCRETWVTRMSRDIGNGQEATRGWRGPPRCLPDGW